MGEVIQLQGDQRKDVQEFLVDKKEGLALDAKTIKVGTHGRLRVASSYANPLRTGSRLLIPYVRCLRGAITRTDGSSLTKPCTCPLPSL